MDNNTKIAKHPGLILDSVKTLAELPQADILLGGDSDKPSVKWRDHLPIFRNQSPTRMCTAYGGTGIGSILESYEHGESKLFSPAELFFRSNGNVNGNSLVNVASAMRDSIVLESDVPTIIPSSWGVSTVRDLESKSKASSEALERGSLYRMKDFAVTSTSHEMLNAYLKKSPIYIAIGIGSGYWLDPAPKPKSYSDYHAVILLEYDSMGCPVIFDSLSGYPNFNGIHRLAPDYDILYGLMFTDLPVDWNAIQSNSHKEDFSFALDHYGKPRDFMKELLSAKFLSDTVKFHPTLSSLFSKSWTVAVNAYVYGGYSVQDLLNHFTSIHRGQGEIFDLNTVRVK